MLLHSWILGCTLMRHHLSDSRDFSKCSEAKSKKSKLKSFFSKDWQWHMPFDTYEKADYKYPKAHFFQNVFHNGLRLSRPFHVLMFLRRKFPVTTNYQQIWHKRKQCNKEKIQGRMWENKNFDKNFVWLYLKSKQQFFFFLQRKTKFFYNSKLIHLYFSLVFTSVSGIPLSEPLDEAWFD